MTLNIYLGPDFPVAQPVIQIESHIGGPIRHPWLDSESRVTGCPGLNRWLPMNSPSLLRVVNEVLTTLGNHLSLAIIL